MTEALLGFVLAAGFVLWAAGAAPARAQAVRTLTLVLENAGTTPVSVAFANLAGGMWGPGPVPEPGSTIGPGESRSFTVEAERPFAPLGGELAVVNRRGGRYLVTWRWARDSAASVRVQATGPSAGVTTRSRVVSGEAPVWQVILH